jgi:hypothetical protein
MKEVGKIIRIELDDETDEMFIVMEITDKNFKRRVMDSGDLKDLIAIKGRKIVSLDQ